MTPSTASPVANDTSINGTVSYTLDPVGNRTQQTSSITGLPTVSLAFNADDLLTSGETYDANGNTTSTGGRTFAYDSQNHLVSMNGGAVTLVYDGDGNRVAKTVSGSTTQYLVDDLNPTGYPQIIEELVGGSVIRTYTYGVGRISEEQVIGGTWTPSFYGYDGGGTVRQLTNSSGVVTDTYNYDAFGNKLNSTGTTSNNYLYRGEQYDPDLGLYYLRARFYNPLAGRFLSRDPNEGKLLEPNTYHKYVYAGADPADRIDPTGRADLLEYSVRLFDFYNDYIGPATSGHDFIKCASKALDEEAADINALVQGEDLPYPSGAIFKDASECESEAISNLIKGPWGLLP